MNSKLAECVGLWLAEGDRKTKSEITFTNNCWDLIKLFYLEVIKNYDGAPRIYVYSRSNSAKVNLGNCSIKYYADKRATKPYCILRLASVKAVKDWANKVDFIVKNPACYPDILRGFFAGEGSVKPSNRILRVSQKKPAPLLDKMLANLEITYKYFYSNRTYEISGKWNWDIFAQHRLADLHPKKRKRFWESYTNYKEIHFPNLKLKSLILNQLKTPSTAKRLASEFERSQSRICDVLIELKKEHKINNFKIGSIDYWTNQNIILISQTKEKYIKLLSMGYKRTSDFAKQLNVGWKSASKRLKELEKLGLVSFNNGNWTAIAKHNMVVM